MGHETRTHSRLVRKLGAMAFRLSSVIDWLAEKLMEFEDWTRGPEAQREDRALDALMTLAMRCDPCPMCQSAGSDIKNETCCLCLGKGWVPRAETAAIENARRHCVDGKRFPQQGNLTTFAGRSGPPR